MKLFSKMSVLAVMATMVSAQAFAGGYAELKVKKHKGDASALPDCGGQVIAERYSDNAIIVSFQSENCSRLEAVSLDGLSFSQQRLNTDYKPYTGSFIISGDLFSRENTVVLSLHSKSGKHDDTITLKFKNLDY